MTRRQRRHERRREHARFTKARNREGRAKVDQSFARTARSRERKAARTEPSGISATLPPRRFLMPHLLPTGTAQRYPMAKQFLDAQSGSGPRWKLRRPLLTYPLGSTTRSARTWSRTHRKHYGRPHGRPRGTL